MWINERKTNDGTIRYQYKERFQDQNGKWFSVSVTLKSNSAHAKKMAFSLLKEKANTKLVSQKKKQEEFSSHLHFEEVCRQWQEATDVAVKELTRRNHAAHLRKILGCLPEKVLFQDVTPALVEKFLFNLYYVDELSFHYVKEMLTTIKAVMRYAKKAGYIKDIAGYEEIQLKRRPATPEELKKRDNKFLDQQELKSCLLQLQRINFRVCLAMEFISLTGLRCGELLALRYEDVELDRKILHVTGTLVATAKNGESIQRGTPKNIYSYRTVELSPRAIRILEWFYTDNKRMKQWGRRGNSLCSSYEEHGYIFTTRTGMPLNREYINHLLRKVNIPGKHLSTHIFRHTHISMLVEQGVPLKAIMKRVGHNDPKTTLAVYTHVTESMQEQMRESLSKIDQVTV